LFVENHWKNMLKNYFKIAFRNLQRQKVYTFINLCGLAVGMACVILILLWVQDEMSYGKSHENSNELYAVSMRDSNKSDSRETTLFSIPYALAPLMKQEFPEVIEFTRIQERHFWESCMLKYGDKVFYDDGTLLVDPSFFRMFTYKFIKGNPKTALEDKNSIVITRKIADKFFGDEEPLGKTLRFNNRQDLIVSGVVENPPHNSVIQFNVVAPIQILDEKQTGGNWAWESSSYILVRKNTDIPEFEQKIAGMFQKHHPMPGMNFIVGIQPVTRIHLYYGEGDIRDIYILVTVAIFILLIACINYMNLSTARYSKRAKEVGLRKVLGAQRGALILQFFLESVLLSIAALLIAFALVEILLPSFNTVTDKNLSFLSLDNLPMICGLVALAFVVGIIAGSYPSIFLSSFQPAVVIRGTAKTNMKSPLLRTALVVAQFSVAIILIISTIMVYRQYDYLIHKDLGYNMDQIVYIPINKEIKQRYESFKNELLQKSDIKNVTVASSLPSEIGYVNSVTWEGKQDDKTVQINFAVVDQDYLNTFGMKFSEGRDFSRNVSSDESNFIINRKAVQLMNLKNPVDKMVTFMGISGKIIGVVDDFNNLPLHWETSPLILTVYQKYYDFFLKHCIIKINSNDISGTLKYIEKVSREFAPDYPFEFKFLDQRVNNYYRSVQSFWYIFEFFTFLAIFISCLGLFGLASFMTELRTKEIGIRKTLGASVVGVVILLSKDFTKWVLLANLIAWPVAYYFMNKWLQDFAYRIDISWWVFVLSGGIALVIALVTVSWQAVKAAKRNPIESLRYE
jgi:putative ABC transport system permease protein